MPEKDYIQGVHIEMDDGSERYYSVPPGGSFRYVKELYMLKILDAKGLSNVVALFVYEPVKPKKVTPVNTPLRIT